MRKKLLSLGFALAVVAAASTAATAAAKSCPEGTYEFQCSQSTRILCCPIGALCFC
ncbi:MAG TPA: hypothetical protein VFR03_05690 [Thermoanaerobaculia bacterium]|nr:hypothetical protein [Thermoanaerobaculia bacterium]